MPEKMSPEEFYRKYYPIVEKRVKGTPLHPETVMAQLVIEGGFKDKVPGNIYFGTKGNGQLRETTEEINGVKKTVKRKFKEYGSFEESLDDYVNNITTNPVYKDSLSAKTPEQQIELIAKGGYASGSGYADLGKQVIKDNKPYIKKIMGNNTAEVVSEEKTSTGKTVKLKLGDGSTLDVPLGANDHVMTVGNNSYIYFADKNKMAKVPDNSKGLNDRFYKMESTFKNPGDVYNLEGHEIMDKVLKANGEMTTDDAKVLQSVMEMDLLSKEEKEKLYPQMAKNVFNPIKKRIESREKELTEQDIKNFRTEKAKLDVDDPKRQEFDAKISDKEKFLSDKAKNDSWRFFDESTMGYEDFKKQADNWFKEVRWDTKNSSNVVTTDPAGQGGAGASASFRYSSKTPGGGGTGPDYSGYYSSGTGIDEKAVALDVDPGKLDQGIVVKKQPTDPASIEKAIAEKQAIVDKIKNQKDEPFVYEPDSQPQHDIAGYLADAGRIAIGMKGANEKLPDYNTSDYFDKYTADAITRKDMGLLPGEKDYMEKGAEDAYAYDIKNIHRLSGGSAGTALGNLGRAANTLSEGYMKVGAMDAAARDQNWANFAGAAGQVEEANRYKFGIDYNEAMMNKQAGSELAATGIENILDRNQYEKTYGKGSPFYNYQKYTAENLKANTDMLKAQKDNMNQNSLSELEKQIAEDQQRLQQTKTATSISAFGDNYKPVEMEQYGKGIINSVISGDGNSSMTAKPKGQFSDGLSVDQIKIMEQKGEPVYNSVFNTTSYKKSQDNISSSFDSKITQLKSDINTGKLDPAIGEAKVRELMNHKKELLDKLNKEQSLWADSQFGEDDSFVGTGEGMPSFDWLEEELNNRLK